MSGLCGRGMLLVRQMEEMLSHKPAHHLPNGKQLAKRQFAHHFIT